MKKKKIFKVEFNISPIKKDERVKTADIDCFWWDIRTNPVVYIAAVDIVSALTKTLLNLDIFAKEVEVKEGYYISGVKGISEYYQETYVD